MGKLSEVVDSLETRINKLLQEYLKLQQLTRTLEDKNATLQEENSRLEQQNQELSQTCHSLKMTNSILGSDNYKRETKLKINALVREIDQCISQLSD